MAVTGAARVKKINFGFISHLGRRFITWQRIG